jgi:hypothetical protein
MKAFLSFVLGVIVGAGAYWYLIRHEPKAPLATAKDNLRNGAAELGRSVEELFDTDRLREELARAGRIIREKASRAGDIIADAATDARTTATIKAKVLKDSGLAGFKIDVDTTDGVVNLSGSVASYEDMAKAMTGMGDGRRQVISGCNRSKGSDASRFLPEIPAGDTPALRSRAVRPIERGGEGLARVSSNRLVSQLDVLHRLVVKPHVALFAAPKPAARRSRAE